MTAIFVRSYPSIPGLTDMEIAQVNTGPCEMD